MRLIFLMAMLWVGGVLPVAAQNHAGASVVADTMPGAELGAKLAKADALLGSRCGTITVGHAASLSTGATLSACHSLRVNAPVLFDGVATITLKGGETIACGGSGAGFASNGKAVFFTVAANATNLDVGAGCTVSNAAGFVQAKSGVKHLRVHDATLLNVGEGLNVAGSAATGLALDDATSDVRFDHNHLTGGVHGLLVVNTHGATCAWNDANGTVNPCQYWGGDADPAHGGTFATGLMTDVDFSHNHCVHVNSCAWGSMGLRVNITYNDAVGCSDTCVDAEGSTQVAIDYNKASGCGNFCASVFFNMREWSISHNQFDAAGAAVGALGVKNSSNAPKLDVDGRMSGNTVLCSNASAAVACKGFSLEATSKLVVDSNVVTDATLAEGGYTPQHTDLTVRDNKLTFTKVQKATAIHLATGIEGSRDSILRNEIVAAGGSVDGVGIEQTLGDFNSSCFSNLEANRITGFRVPISTASASKNAGVRDNWTLKNNVVDRAVQHTGSGPVDVYQP